MEPEVSSHLLEDIRPGGEEREPTTLRHRIPLDRDREGQGQLLQLLLRHLQESRERAPPSLEGSRPQNHLQLLGPGGGSHTYLHGWGGSRVPTQPKSSPSFLPASGPRYATSAASFPWTLTHPNAPPAGRRSSSCHMEQEKVLTPVATSTPANAPGSQIPFETQEVHVLTCPCSSAATLALTSESLTGREGADTRTDAESRFQCASDQEQEGSSTGT